MTFSMIQVMAVKIFGFMDTLEKLSTLRFPLVLSDWKRALATRPYVPSLSRLIEVSVVSDPSEESVSKGLQQELCH